MINNKKKGQVTIFIIIGIIIISGVVLFFILKDDVTGSENGKMSQEIGHINNYVKECVDYSTREVLYTIGQGAGYYYPPERSMDLGITLYVKEGKTYIPSKENIEEEISKYVSKEIKNCTGNFSDFPNFNISQNKITTSTQIEKEKVVFDIKYPLSIKKQNQTYRISEFSETVFARTGVIYDSIKEFERNNTQKVSLVDISRIISDKRLEVDFMDYNNETVIFNITDTGSQLNGKSLSWIFANEY